MKWVFLLVLIVSGILAAGGATALGVEQSPSQSPSPADEPTLVPVVMLGIDIDGPASAEPGTQVQLDVVVRNDGPDSADRWGVAVDAGDGVTIEAISHEIACDDLGDCRDDPLEAGERVVLAVRASVDADCVDEGGPEPVCWADAGTCGGQQNFMLHFVCALREPPPYEITSFDLRARAYAEAIDGNNVPEDEWAQPFPVSDETRVEIFGWNVEEAISMKLIPSSVRMPDTGASSAVALALALALLSGGAGVLRGGLVRNREQPTT